VLAHMHAKHARKGSSREQSRQKVHVTKVLCWSRCGRGNAMLSGRGFSWGWCDCTRSMHELQVQQRHNQGKVNDRAPSSPLQPCFLCARSAQPASACLPPLSVVTTNTQTQTQTYTYTDTHTPTQYPHPQRHTGWVTTARRVLSLTPLLPPPPSVLPHRSCVP